MYVVISCRNTVGLSITRWMMASLKASLFGASGSGNPGLPWMGGNTEFLTLYVLCVPLLLAFSLSLQLDLSFGGWVLNVKCPSHWLTCFYTLSLITSWWHCCGAFRRQSFAGGSVPLWVGFGILNLISLPVHSLCPDWLQKSACSLLLPWLPHRSDLSCFFSGILEQWREK